MELLSFLNEKIDPVLEALEKERKKIIWNGRRNQLIPLVLFAVYLAQRIRLTQGPAAYLNDAKSLIILFLATAVALLSMKPQLFVVPASKANKYKEKFKEDVIFAFLNLYNMHIEYKPCFKTSDNYLNHTHLFNKQITESIEHDGILGELTNTDFRVSQTLLYKNVSVFFQGLIILIKQPTDYGCQIMINSDKVKSHDSFFEIARTEYFTVKSNSADFKADSVFDRQIQLIEELHLKLNKHEINATMADNHLYLALEQKKNIFDLSFRNVIKQKDFICSNLELLGAIMDFIQENDKLFASSVSEMNQNMA
jgi:hypothetical protein